MKKLLLLLLCASPAFAQTFAGSAGSDVFVNPPFRFCWGVDNGQNDCTVQTRAQEIQWTGSIDFKWAFRTVATLPAASVMNQGRTYEVTDGQTTTDCTTGGGSALAICTSNGSAWTALGGIGVAGLPSTLANCTATGTTQGYGVEFSTQVVASVTQVCGQTATSNSQTTVAVCTQGCGTTGNATLVYSGLANTVLDGTGSAGDYVIPSSTAGQFHDIGASKPGGTVETFGVVTIPNTGGAGSLAQVYVQPLSLFASGGTSNGGTTNSAPQFDLGYYSQPGSTNVISGDACTTDGSGHQTCKSYTTSSSGAGTITYSTGTSPSLPPAGNATTYVDSGSNQFTCLLSSGVSCNPAGTTMYIATTNGLKCDNSTDDTSALSTLITAIGSQQAAIQFPLNKKCVLGNVTIPTNVMLDFSAGAAFQAVTSDTITIKGGLSNPDNHQIFYNANSGTTGTVDFTGNTQVTTVFPEWWGAVASGGTASNNTIAIQNAVYGAFGCGPVIACRTNSSGNYKWNKVLKLTGNYQINGQINFYHVISFTVYCDARNHAGITQTASNTEIIDGQSVAYGVFNGCSWTSTASQNLSNPLMSLDYNSSQGADIATQFVDFNSNSWNGTSVTKTGFQLSRSGGGAQGSSIHFYDNSAINFTEAAFMIGAGSGGSQTQLATNAVEIKWVGGDIQTCPAYGIENFGGGSLSIDTTTFENGFTAQTGYDIYSTQAPAGEWTTINNVRSEARRLAGGGNISIRDSFVVDQASAAVPGNSPAVGTILEGSTYGGDGVWYKVSVQGALGGLGTIGSPRSASAGGATSITDSVGGLTVNAYTGYQVTVIGGTGAYQYCVVTSNTASVITCTAGWKTRFSYARYSTGFAAATISNPDNTSQFIIEPNWGSQTTSGGATWTSMGEEWTEGYILANNLFVPGEQMSIDYRARLVASKFTRADWNDSGNGAALFAAGSIANLQNVLVVDQNNSNMSYRTWTMSHPDVFTGIPGYNFDFKGAVPVCWGDGTSNPGATTKDDICMGINGGGTFNLNNNSSGTPALANYDASGNLNLQGKGTAATAASSIALGSGGTNANSADSGAGAATLSMTLNINVGDFVIIFTNGQDTSQTVTDNGAGGGNTYLSLGQVGTNRGKAMAWYVQSATVSASQVTVADAANAYSISGATYVNVLGIGNPITPVNQSSNSLSMSVTTLQPSSLVVGCFTFNTATTFTPTGGVTVTSSFNGTNTVNTAMMSRTTTTAGAYTLTATTNQGTPVSQGLAVELMVNTGTSHNGPAVTMAGTGWTGAASAAQTTTIQGVVPNASAPLQGLAVTPSLAVTSPGSFNNSRSDNYLSASVGGSSSALEFQGVSRPTNALSNSAIYGGIIIPTTATQTQTNGVFGAVHNYSTTSYAVGGYFSALAGAASTKTFGLNAIVMDGGFVSPTNLVGAEIDITQSNSDSSCCSIGGSASNGIRVLSNGTHRPGAGVLIIGSSSTNDNFTVGLMIDDANSGDTAANRMIYLIPPDNLQTTNAVQLRNHTNAADVFDITDAGGIKPTTYLSQTNCAASGTAANPSVASCSAAPAGSFACATAASGGTCQVNTTAVTAASEIFITQRTDTTTGTTLSVTCNTGVSTVIPVVTAVTAATSFTINLGTFNTNPECFSYHIIN